eukprot:scaffold461_cov321-Pavlova_lutheri.AAC.44
MFVAPAARTRGPARPGRTCARAEARAARAWMVNVDVCAKAAPTSAVANGPTVPSWSRRREHGPSRTTAGIRVDRGGVGGSSAKHGWKLGFGTIPGEHGDRHPLGICEVEGSDAWESDWRKDRDAVEYAASTDEDSFGGAVPSVVWGPGARGRASYVRSGIPWVRGGPSSSSATVPIRPSIPLFLLRSGSRIDPSLADGIPPTSFPNRGSSLGSRSFPWTNSPGPSRVPLPFRPPPPPSSASDPTWLTWTWPVGIHEPKPSHRIPPVPFPSGGSTTSHPTTERDRPGTNRRERRWLEPKKNPGRSRTWQGVEWRIRSTWEMDVPRDLPAFIPRPHQPPRGGNSSIAITGGRCERECVPAVHSTEWERFRSRRAVRRAERDPPRRTFRSGSVLAGCTANEQRSASYGNASSRGGMPRHSRAEFHFRFTISNASPGGEPALSWPMLALDGAVGKRTEPSARCQATSTVPSSTAVLGTWPGDGPGTCASLSLPA